MARHLWHVTVQTESAQQSFFYSGWRACWALSQPKDQIYMSWQSLDMGSMCLSSQFPLLNPDLPTTAKSTVVYISTPSTPNRPPRRQIAPLDAISAFKTYRLILVTNVLKFIWLRWGNGGPRPGNGGPWPGNGGPWPGNGGPWPGNGGHWPGNGGHWPGNGGEMAAFDREMARRHDETPPSTVKRHSRPRNAALDAEKAPTTLKEPARPPRRRQTKTLEGQGNVAKTAVQKSSHASRYSCSSLSVLALKLLFLNWASFFRHSNSCWTSTKVNQPLLRNWMRAPLPRSKDSLVRASTNIFWWGTHLIILRVSCKSRSTIASSNADFRSCFPLGCSRRRQSYRLLASVTFTCDCLSGTSSCCFITSMWGDKLLRHASSLTSWKTASRYIICSQSTSFTPCSIAWVSPPNVLNTFLFNLDDLQVIGDALTGLVPIGRLSHANTIQAPWVASVGSPISSVSS